MGKVAKNSDSTVAAPQPQFEFLFVAMGQGDCTMVRCPNRDVVIIDCGHAAKGLGEKTTWWEEAALILRDWCGDEKKIKALILSHKDQDHINMVTKMFLTQYQFEERELTNSTNGNRKYTLEPLNIEKIYYSGDVKLYTAGGTNHVIHEYNSERISVVNGDPRDVISDGNWSVKIIASEVPVDVIKEDNEDTCTSDNAGSIVTLFSIGEKKALICADTTFSTERHLLFKRRTEITDCALIQVPHHGSENASSKDFVKLVNPEAAIVSVGFIEHSHRHPRGHVIDKWLDDDTRLAKSTSSIHEFDSWYPCHTDDNKKFSYSSILATWEKEGLKATSTSNESTTTFLSYATKSNYPIAVRRISESNWYLFRDSTTNSLYMTSQGTHVFFLNSQSIKYEEYEPYFKRTIFNIFPDSEEGVSAKRRGRSRELNRGSDDDRESRSRSRSRISSVNSEYDEQGSSEGEKRHKNRSRSRSPERQ
jgi:beta-lactamase superfamily II metal-dependent hydrolase